MLPGGPPLLYNWVVFAHLVGVFGFLLAHGVSVSMPFRLRRERDPRSIRALLDLSAGTRMLMYGSLALLLAAGVTAGFMGHWWGQVWIWAALAVLVLMTLAVFLVGTPYFRQLRKAVAMADVPDSSATETTADAEDLRTLLASARPLVVSAVGIAGLAIILWLMVIKPF